MIRRAPSVRQASSLVEILQARAAEAATTRAYTFLANGEEESACLSFAELDRRARAIAAELQQSGMEGQPVLLLYPSGLEFVAAFFGCLYAGAIAVPAYPPGSSRSLPRLHAIIGDARPRAVLTESPLVARARASLSSSAAGESPVLATDTVPDAAADAWRRPGTAGGDLAFLQYTSGSTTSPRGVMVSHANLLHNERAIQEAFGQCEQSLVVSWLPLYHDMGLIGGVLQPLFTGAGCVLMPPASFLQKPRRWLAAISRYRADTSGGPNFAYDLCVRKIAEEERAGLDLTSWRVAFDGAEPVRAGTLRQFAEAFAGCGFRYSSFHPCYGLAEATLMVSGSRPAAAPVVVDLDTAALRRGEVTGANAGAEGTSTLAGCGGVGGEQEVRIVEPQTLEVLAAGRVGEIWISGPSVASGYWGRREESEETFGALLADAPERRFLRTGDLGFLRAGQLFVTGRLKDLLILRGRNHYPQDLEVTAERSHPALRPGCGAAFSLTVEGEERAAIVHELERGREGEAQAAAEALRAAVAREHEIQLHAVALIRRGSLPKTTSGKVQRRTCRERLLAGDLPVILHSREAAALPFMAPRVTAESLLAVDRGEWPQVLEAYLRSWIAGLLGMNLDDVSPAAPLASLGLDSLKVMELRNEIEESFGVSLEVADVLESPGLPDLTAAVLSGLEGPHGELQTLPRGSREHPLSAGQRALWFLHRLAPASSAYNLAAAVRVRGPLSPVALRRALQALVDRHPALRCAIGEQAGAPVQRLGDGVEAQLAWIEAPDWSEEKVREALAEEAWRPFDLAKPPLLRVAVVAGREDRRMVLAIHHIVADFWSLAVLLRELELLYREEDGAPLPALEPASVSYGDFVAWQDSMLAGAAGERHWHYWRHELGGDLPEVALPADRPRPPMPSFRGAARSRRLPADLAEALAALARRSGTTVFTVLLAGLQAMLHRYTGEEDLLVGTPAAGRPAADFAAVVGYFVNPVVLRAALLPELTFKALIEQARQKVLGALRHQDLPFPEIVERLCPERQPSRNPLFQVMLVLHQAHLRDQGALGALAAGVPGAVLPLGPLTLEAIALEQRAALLDLTLAAAELDGGLLLSLQFSTDLFDGATAERMLRHYESLLRGARENPDQPLRDLPLLGAAERAQLLREWSSARAEIPEPRLIHGLFEAQVRRTPDAPAITCDAHEGLALSYGELDARANRLAHHLVALGVGPEVPVGVLLDRTPDLVVGLLAVLKAGGAYVPLDPAYPSPRLAFYLRDAAAPVLLSRSALAAAVPSSAGARRVLLDGDAAEIWRRPAEPPRRTATERNLAYVIYTSGSTGRPKGVAIEHLSAAVFLHWAREVFPAADLRAVLAATSICFDLSVFEIFAPLSWGGTVVLVDNALRLAAPSPPPPDISLVNTVPSVLAEVLRGGGLPASVRTVSLAGEPLPSALVEQLAGLGTVERLLNLYGPTEATTYSTFARVPWDGHRQPAIGRPVTGTRAYVVDGGMEPLPAGAPGQLLLGGAGLARGYLGRPELTAERFVPDPFGGEPGGRLYRTGDLCRYRAEGELEFLERIDQQVKIRGFRIELGEVEAAVAAHPAVAEAVVVSREDRPGERRLVAYVVAAEGCSPGASELREALAARLPAFMLPAAWVVLGSLPRTANGKLDRRALPAPEEGSPAAPAAPQSPLEVWLAGVWRDLLGIAAVGRNDSFFHLGGHSLLASRLAARVRQEAGVELPLAAIFAGPTLAGLARRIEGLGQPLPLDAMLPAPRTRDLPLSFAQQRIWFLHRLQPASPAYNMAGALRVTGRLDRAALERALVEIVRRHEALRTRFPETAGGPLQVIGPAGGPLLAHFDLRSLPPAAGTTEIVRLLTAEARRPFDLGAAAPLRVLLVRTAKDEHAVLLAMHHIVADGWSVEILRRELSALYGAFAAGLPSPLAELPVQYADFAGWQRAWLAGPALDSRLAWWRDYLAGAPPALELPLDHPRPAVQSLRGAACRSVFPGELAVAFHALCRACGATSFMTLLAGLGALLGRYAESEDLLIGSPAANRGRPEVQDLIGCFVNVLALRVKLGGRPGFTELLRRVREDALGAYAHQDLPFEKLVECLGLPRDASRSPLFQVVLAVGQPAVLPQLGGLKVEPLAVDLGVARFDLTLFVEDRQDGLELTLEYGSGLFEEATARRFLAHLEILLAAALAAPERTIADLPLVTGPEAQQLLVEWNRTDAALPGDAGVHQRVELWAERTPEAPAVVAGSLVLTYAELNRRANRLAHYLLAFGIGPESVVGVCSERSPAMVTAELAVLKAGAAYLPLDPINPEERLAFMVRDAKAALLLAGASGQFTIAPPGLRVLPLEPPPAELAACSERNPGLPVGLGQLAYVIYTSGSTGRPKGVEVEHRGLLNLVLWHTRTYGVSASDRVTHLAAPGFDAAVWEIWSGLFAGASLHLPDEPVRSSPADLVRWLSREAITCSFLPTPLAEAVLRESWPATAALRVLLTGGDCLRMAPPAQLPFCLVNHYGPTENSVVATCAIVGAGEPGPPPIGVPIDNVRAYVLDVGLRPVPVGVAGELCLGGLGLARGYRGQPEVTAERFVPDAWSGRPGGRLYRTGDRVRWLPRGCLQFLGRADHQVKVRGFRVELGEIEAVLRQHPGVAQAAVRVRADLPAAEMLVAYVVAAADPAADEELRAFLRARLPGYMIPAVFVPLAALPLTRNGKIDLRALPRPEPQGRGFTAPRNSVEEFLAGIYADLLKLDRVGVFHSFFELGGNSLLAAQLVSRVRDELGVELPLSALFESPSVVELTAILARIAANEEAPPAPGWTAVAEEPRLIESAHE
jgi:amino acid adenylation domain-containing protein